MLLYGATGFTGRLIAERAVALGMRPVLAGRSGWPLAGIARSLGLEHRVFGLGDAAAVDRGLADMPLVLNVAGPFSQTARPLVGACLRGRKHYLDITGEVAVLEETLARDAEAKAAGILLLPGVGFDVVPTDCLALQLKQQLPDARSLVLAVRARTVLSHGTAETLLEKMGGPGLVRLQGVLTPIPIGSLRRDTPFPAVAIPWGDLATAFRSTGIPNIEIYFAAGTAERLGLALSKLAILRPLLGAAIRASAKGPDETLRRTGRAFIWGQVTNASGMHVEASLETPEPYALTVESALAAVKRVLGGRAPAGAHTPATAFGSAFVREIPGVK